jgi:6-phosphogluconolactonase
MAFRPEIHVLNDLSAWSTEAATLTLDLRRQALEERGRFLIALSGGRTPRQLYQRLASVSTGSEWTGTDFFFSDERCVPPDHPESNFHLANQALFRPLRISQSRIHRMRGEHPDPHAGAMEYEDLLRSVANEAGDGWPHLDLVLLGIGNDGHTASLFPNTDALHERRRWVAVGHAPFDPPTRLTLTLGVINQATVVLFLVSGESKAGIIKTLLEPKQECDRQLPAALVRPERGRLIWVLDGAAAAELTGYSLQNRRRPI